VRRRASRVAADRLHLQMRAFAWILLYPEGTSLAVVSIAGQQTRLVGIEFDQLLALLDRVEELVHTS
jgi:hypothetical protein